MPHDEEEAPTASPHSGAWNVALSMGLMVIRDPRVRPESIAAYSPSHAAILVPDGLTQDQEDAAIMWALQRCHLNQMN